MGRLKKHLCLQRYPWQRLFLQKEEQSGYKASFEKIKYCADSNSLSLWNKIVKCFIVGEHSR